MLEKVVQVEGRKQLGLNFGSGDKPNCRGLTLEEISGYDKDGNKVGEGLDFSKMDFSEFIDELRDKFSGEYKEPNPEDIKCRIEDNLNIQKYDGNEDNPENNVSGWQKETIKESGKES